MSAEDMVLIAKQNVLIFTTNTGRSLLDQGLAYKCYCTEEELEQEREEQTARGETPRYSGKHRNLTAEQRQAFEAEGRMPSIRFRVPEGRTYTL